MRLEKFKKFLGLGKINDNLYNIDLYKFLDENVSSIVKNISVNTDSQRVCVSLEFVEGVYDIFLYKEPKFGIDKNRIYIIGSIDTEQITKYKFLTSSIIDIIEETRLMIKEFLIKNNAGYELVGTDDTGPR